MGSHPSWADEYEWVRLADLSVVDTALGSRTPGGHRTTGAARTRGAARTTDAVAAWLRTDPVWLPDEGARVLLVDLDNLRAGPLRWRARMALVVALARSADHVVMAGQQAAVERARPHLDEFADIAIGVPDGLDLADHVLLDGAGAIEGRRRQVAVLSNDGIFADLAQEGPLVVVSPGADALSDRLVDAARHIVDLTSVERLALTR